jgi:hypothetical protein
MQWELEAYRLVGCDVKLDALYRKAHAYTYPLALLALPLVLHDPVLPLPGRHQAMSVVCSPPDKNACQRWPCM